VIFVDLGLGGVGGGPKFCWKSFKKIDISRVFFFQGPTCFVNGSSMFLELCMYIFRLHKHMVCNVVYLKLLDGHLPTPCSCTCLFHRCVHVK